MPVTSPKTFLYGSFRPAEEANQLPIPAAMIVPVRNSTPDIALEILREFSATEFVGRVYMSRNGNWAPVSQPGIRDYIWYQDFPRKKLHFVSEGSNPWDVLFFRQESDESGPYVAVGLKLTS